ncbi:MAG: hypothetical protein ABR915_02320 [Thermoguttaceae bacterium]
MRSAKIPSDAQIVRTFVEYRTIVDAFFRWAFNLLIIIGRSGMSKSKEFEFRSKHGECYTVKGHATPYYTYKELYGHRNQLIVIDDGEMLWKEKDGRILLRSLTESEACKKVHWASANKDLEELGIPTSFRTRSKVAVICNKFMFGKSDEKAAILDRAQVVYFDPTPLEVHTNTATWFWDQEVYDYIGSRLSVITNLTARTYVKACEQKNAGMDWQALIDVVNCYDFAMALVQNLETSGLPRQKRIEEFTAKTKMSQATYYNYRKMLLEQGQLKTEPPPAIRVQGTEPDDENEAASELDDESDGEDGWAEVAPIPLETGTKRSRRTRGTAKQGPQEASSTLEDEEEGIELIDCSGPDWAGLSI